MQNKVGTFMIEVTDAKKRILTLYAMGHVEDCFQLQLLDTNNQILRMIYGKPIGANQTSPDGKTSSLHFIRFEFTNAEAIQSFTLANRIKIVIDHPNYKHQVDLPETTRQALLADFQVKH